MPANVKTDENITKHRTKAEIEARQQAEADFLPMRPAKLKIPKSLGKDPAARRHWNSILKRADGLAILDDLDAEMLAVYCSALSRRDALNDLCREHMAALAEAEDADQRLELVEKLDGLISKLQGHEKTLLSYADKLGMTPEGRVRLARKRAAQVENPQPDDDLFGD